MKSISSTPVKICCTGLTVYDLPFALKVSDIAIVEENDGVTWRQYCEIVVKTPQVAQVISRHFKWWRRDEPGAKRFEAAAFYVVGMRQEHVLSRLEALFDGIEYVLDWDPSIFSKSVV